MKFVDRRFFIAGAIATIPVAVASQTKFVDTALILSTDVSGSIDDNEYLLQKRGIAEAFRSEQMRLKLKEMSLGVCYHEWDTTSSFGDWHIIETFEDAKRFADSVMNTPRRSKAGNTFLFESVIQACEHFDTFPFQIGRKVIDVSGDGADSNPISTQSMLTANLKASAAVRRIQVNGLPIVTDEEPTLHTYYEQNVITGDGAFMIVASGFERFGEAFIRKLGNEIG